MYNIYVDDALGHHLEVDSFESLEEAKKAFEEYKNQGPEGYELSIELEEIIGDYEDFISIEYHEWLTEEEWMEKHPSGYPE